MIAGLVAAALIALGGTTAGSAQAATTITVAPAAPVGSNSFPFGVGTGTWTPNVLYFYKNIPAFNLKAGDVLAFDLTSPNNVDIQLAIALAATTVNGGDVPTGALSQVVLNSVLPANPRGNTIVGDYELQFTTQAGFNFPGGGLIIRFSTPGGAFATDNVNNSVFNSTLADDTDPAGFFIRRQQNEPDGEFPWTGGIETQYIPGFRLILQDFPAPAAQTPATTTTPKKKKCKRKKRKGAAAKKCKRKKRRK